jgi:hypothetical protein
MAMARRSVSYLSPQVIFPRRDFAGRVNLGEIGDGLPVGPAGGPERERADRAQESPDVGSGKPHRGHAGADRADHGASEGFQGGGPGDGVVADRAETALRLGDGQDPGKLLRAPSARSPCR